MPNGGSRLYTPKPTFGHISRARRGAAHCYLGFTTKLYGRIKIHRAVCEAFHGAPPFEGAVVLHLDEDGCNNVPDNLRWGTQRDNLNAPGFRSYCSERSKAAASARERTRDGRFA